MGRVTNFDCWHPTEEKVSADYAIKNLIKNTDNVQKVIREAAALIAAELPDSIAHNALAQAFVRPIETMNEHTKVKLTSLLRARYCQRRAEVVTSLFKQAG